MIPRHPGGQPLLPTTYLQHNNAGRKGRKSRKSRLVRSACYVLLVGAVIGVAIFAFAPQLLRPGRGKVPKAEAGSGSGRVLSEEHARTRNKYQQVYDKLSKHREAGYEPLPTQQAQRHLNRPTDQESGQARVPQNVKHLTEKLNAHLERQRSQRDAGSAPRHTVPPQHDAHHVEVTGHREELPVAPEHGVPESGHHNAQQQHQQQQQQQQQQQVPHIEPQQQQQAEPVQAPNMEVQHQQQQQQQQHAPATQPDAHAGHHFDSGAAAHTQQAPHAATNQHGVPEGSGGTPVEAAVPTTGINVGREEERPRYDPVYAPGEREASPDPQPAQDPVHDPAPLHDPSAPSQSAQAPQIEAHGPHTDTAHEVVFRTDPLPLPTQSDGLYGLTARSIDGEEVHLSRYAGKVLLIVNVASACGYTDVNYQGLQQAYDKYKDHGLEILGFPCNQFGQQEPGNDPEIKEFCASRYHVTFPMFSKIEVNGPTTHPVFKFLKTNLPESEGGGGGHGPGQDIAWNFFKFLVDHKGNPVKRFDMQYHAPAVEDELYRLLSERQASLAATATATV